jgi:hypothetical protein
MTEVLLQNRATSMILVSGERTLYVSHFRISIVVDISGINRKSCGLRQVAVA